MNKSNKMPLVVGIVAALAVVAVVIGVVVANGAKKGNDGDKGETSNVETTQPDDTVNEELNNPSTSVSFGDYEAMSKLAKEIQNGEKVGEVVSVDGVVSKVASSYSITEKNDGGSESIGTVFEIEGEGEDYPVDGAHAIVTGKVVEKSPMVFVIQVLPGRIVRIED